MKFGCCLNMVATQPDGIGAEWIDTVVQCGYDYLEMPMAQMMALNDDEFEALKERIDSSGISCETSNNFFPADLRLTGPDADLSEALNYAGKALEKAEDLGVQYLVFGSGPAKMVPDGFPIESGYQQVVLFLKNIVPIAREHQVTIVIEPLRKAECNLINSFAEGVKLAKDVNDPAVRVLVDFYHFTVEQESVQCILDNGAEYLRHVHFANPFGRVYPADIHEADYKPFIDVLKQIGYDAHISCEAYAPDGFKVAAMKAKEFLDKQFL